MKRLFVIIFMLFAFVNGAYALPKCVGSWSSAWDNCFGTHTLASGSKYVGEYKNGKKHGQGAFTYASGSKYVGEYENGKRHGQGTYTNYSGSKYVGEWIAGFQYGHAITYFADGSVNQEGIFYYGELQYARDDKLVCELATAGGSGSWFTHSMKEWVIEAKKRGLDCGVEEVSLLNDLVLCKKATKQKNGNKGWQTNYENKKYVDEAKMRGLSCRVGTQTATIALGASTLPKCVGSLSTWTNCYGKYTNSNGDKYVGEFKDGKYHGKGSLSFVNGANYTGSFEDGKFHGKGTFKHLNGATYVGGYNKGMLDGQGTFIWINGDRYVGQYKNGKKDGLGTLTWKSGGKFVGQYKADLINGQGEESFPNGNTYVGEYKNGEFDGQGTFTWVNGDRYVGQYKNGKKDGLGSLFYIDGAKYVGWYKNGKPDGSGEEVYANGNTYVGEYKNGEFDGQGTFTWVNGDRYVGQYKNGLRNGQGSSSWANGDTYVGQQKNGKFHGRGTYTWPNGGKYVGEYNDGLQEGTGEEIFPNGDRYLGEYKKAKFHGQGTLINIDGRVQTGTWNDGKFENVETIKPQLVNTQTKVALLIGNSKYEYAKDLRNPSNDVNLLKAKLLGLGFSVDTLLDGKRVGMTDAILEFGRKVQNSDISLLFYAGHSVEAQGLNYLIPTDAEILSENGLEPKAIPLNWVLKQIKLTKTLSIALLDSCRDNPFADRMYKTKSRSVASRGLAKVKVEGNQFIGFAAAPGQVASDGVGSNSPYTNALVKYISAQDEINYMFRKIKTEVQTTTSGNQVPYVENNLGAELIYLHK